MTRRKIIDAAGFAIGWLLVLGACPAFWMALWVIACNLIAGPARGDSIAVDRWDIETSRPAPYPIKLWRGETVYLEPRYLSYSEAHNISNVTEVVLRYRDDTLPAGYYYACTGSVLTASEGRIRIVWTPDQEASATNYTYTIAAKSDAGDTLRGFGTIKLSGVVDGSRTNQPGVVTTFDWASVEHLNLASAPFLLAGQATAATGVTARAVSYDNPSYTNVQEALDTLLYVAPSVSLSGGGVYDIGRTIADVDLVWTVNKEMLTRELTGGATVSLGAGGSGAYTVTNALDDSQTTYTLTVGDGTGTAAASTVNYFRHRRYWGFSSTSTALSDAQIQALSNELATSRATSKSGLTPTGSQYLWICYPASWGAASATLLGGWPTTMILETASFTNAHGNAASYYRYRSPHLIGITTSLEVQ